MRTLAWRVESNTFVLLHGEGEPTDAEWEAYLADMRAHLETSDVFRVLVITGGPSPNAHQRKLLNQVIRGRDAPTAVLTASAVGRAVTSILRLRNRFIRAFEPGRLEEAFQHLKLEEAEQKKVRQAIEALQREMGRSSPE